MPYSPTGTYYSSVTPKSGSMSPTGVFYPSAVKAPTKIAPKIAPKTTKKTTTKTPVATPVAALARTVLSSDSSTSNTDVSTDPFNIEKLLAGLPEYKSIGYSGSRYTPSKTPAQRAQEIMDAKYGRISANIKSRIGSLDSDLALGQATQDNYAVKGDASLKNIYGDLTNVNQGIANQIKGIYGDATQVVGQSYDPSLTGLNADAGQAQKMLSTQAQQLGISQGVPGASQGIQDYTTRAGAQLGIDKTNSINNSTALGANMSAAALKDVSSAATYGADNRRDLVMKVQETKTNLQIEHDKAKKLFMDDLQAVEDEKQDAIAAATTDNERYDAERSAEDAKNELQNNWENRKQQLTERTAYINEGLAKLKAVDDHSTTLATNEVARGTLKVQEAAQKEMVRNNIASTEIEKQTLTQAQSQFEGNMALNWAKFGHDQQNDALNRIAQNRGLDIQNEELQLRRNDYARAIINDIWARGQAPTPAQLTQAINDAHKKALNEANESAAEIKRINSVAELNTAKASPGGSAATKFVGTWDQYLAKHPQLDVPNMSSIVDSIFLLSATQMGAPALTANQRPSIKNYATMLASGGAWDKQLEDLVRDYKLPVTKESKVEEARREATYNRLIAAFRTVEGYRAIPQAARDAITVAVAIRNKA